MSDTPTKDNSPVVEMSCSVESTDEGVFSVTTNTRYNAEGEPLTSMQKSLISNLSDAIENKNLTIDERNLTSTQWVEYHVGTKRKSYNSLPTSNITAEAVTVDGFALSQKDNAGVTTTTERSYTANGMIQTRTDGLGNTTTTVTDIAGRVLTVTDAAGHVTTTAYGSAHDLPATVTDAQSNTSCYRYDVRGRKVAEWGTGIQPVCFGYDDANRMTSLTTFRASAETVSTDPCNRADDDTTIWSYHDASGMEISKAYADNSSVVKTYDAENRPESFTNTETNTVIECAYDHMGRRATKKVTVDGGITLHQRYLYRGYLQIACCDLTRSNHPALWFITWDPTQPIATRTLAIQKDGTWYTYGWDLTKNVCEIYGTNGYIRTSYTYTPYGSVTESSNSIYQPIQWSSEYNDTELGLVYYNYRHYNPMDGRWIGRDREEKGSNLYLFSKNNTPRYLDHLGNVFVLPSHSTSGIPGAQQEHVKPLPPPKPKNGCLISICCRHPYSVPGIMRAHCIIRFLYNSGTVKGCRGGPSGDGPSNPKTNRKNGNPPNNQSPHCNGCCGSFGNVIAGCGEITTPKGEDDKLQIGLNIDLEVAEQDHNRCVTAKDTTVEDCNRIYECMKKKMDEITNACYIYSSLGNNSNTSWQTAYKSCIGELINPMGNQPGNKNFDTNKKCKNKS